MDSGESLEKLVTVGDCPDGWRTVCRLVEALEHSGITSLHPRLLEIGGMNANGFVIELNVIPNGRFYEARGNLRSGFL